MLKEKLSSYEIILASQSPRRIKFLNELDIQFKSVKLDFDESYPNNLMAEQITDFIADKIDIKATFNVQDKSTTKILGSNKGFK